MPARWRGLAAWAGTLLYMALLFWLSSRPGHDVSRWNFLRLPDYVLHGVAYLVLGVLLHWALAATLRWPFAATAWAAVILAGLYGLSDEWHQSFVPGRTATWQDFAVDVAGAALAQLVLRAWTREDRNQVGDERISD